MNTLLYASRHSCLQCTNIEARLIEILLISKAISNKCLTKFPKFSQFIEENFFPELLNASELNSGSMDLSSYDGSQSPRSGGAMTPNSRNKRMRTSFKHHQLRTMKSYFAINQNPDAKDLKQLAQKTGLSKRVLQVDPTLCILPLQLKFRIPSGLVSKCTRKVAPERDATRRKLAESELPAKPHLVHVNRNPHTK